MLPTIPVNHYLWHTNQQHGSQHLDVGLNMPKTGLNTLMWLSTHPIWLSTHPKWVSTFFRWVSPPKHRGVETQNKVLRLKKQISQHVHSTLSTIAFLPGNKVKTILNTEATCKLRSSTCMLPWFNGVCCGCVMRCGVQHNNTMTMSLKTTRQHDAIVSSCCVHRHRVVVLNTTATTTCRRDDHNMTTTT